MIVVWLGLAIYLALFFLSTLPSTAGHPDGILRRGAFWGWLLLPDELLRSWLGGASVQSIVQRGAILAAAAVMLLVAWGAGWSALHLLKIDRLLTRLETHVFAVGAGLNLVSLIVLALGLCGMLDRTALIALAVAAVISPLRAWHARRETAFFDASPSIPRWVWWCGAPFVVVYLASAMLPPADFDVLEYHLQAPKEFFQQGAVTFVPHNVYANMPLGAEMLALAGMTLVGDWWLGALVGKTLIASFAILTSLSLLALGRRCVSPFAGGLAAIVYLSTPWIAYVSTQGLNDGVLAFYTFAALSAVVVWRELRPLADSADRMLLLTGFLAGGAAACKYPGVVYSVLPLLAWIAWQSRSRFSSGTQLSSFARPVVIYLLAVVAGCGLWYAKNAALSGNPTYPLLYGVFGGTTRTAENDAQWRRAHAPPNFDADDLVGRAADITLRSQWLSPLMMPLAALALAVHPQRRLVWLLLGYWLLILAVWWLFTHRIERFWIAALPLPALLAGIGATWNNCRWWRATLIVFLAVGLTFNFLVIASGRLFDNRYLASLDELRKDPRIISPAHAYLNAHAADIRGVLLVGDAAPFDLNVAVVYNTVFDEPRFEALARDRSPAEVRRALGDLGVSHVLVSWDEIERYRSPGNYGITDFFQPLVFGELVASGVLAAVDNAAFDEDGNQLFRLID